MASQALEAIRVLKEHMPLARARMRLRITCTSAGMLQTVIVKTSRSVSVQCVLSALE